jgi:hypothetical protein
MNCEYCKLPGIHHSNKTTKCIAFFKLIKIRISSIIVKSTKFLYNFKQIRMELLSETLNYFIMNFVTVSFIFKFLNSMQHFLIWNCGTTWHCPTSAAFLKITLAPQFHILTPHYLVPKVQRIPELTWNHTARFWHLNNGVEWARLSANSLH